MGYILERLTGIWKTRGPFGFLRFLFSRLVRIDKDLVFDTLLTDTVADKDITPEIGTLVEINRHTIQDPAIKALVGQVLTEENRHYADGLRQNDLMFVVVGTGEAVLHYSCIQFESRYKALLGEAPETPLFTHCWTAAEARGRKLYPTVLQYGCKTLAALGHDRAVITCHPDNIASIKGIERAGFNRQHLITSLIFLSRFAIQKIVPPPKAARWRCTRL